MEFLGILLTAFVGIIIVALNVWYRRQLTRMTPEERTKEEEEQRRDSSIW